MLPEEAPEQLRRARAVGIGEHAVIVADPEMRPASRGAIVEDRLHHRPPDLVDEAGVLTRHAFGGAIFGPGGRRISVVVVDPGIAQVLAFLIGTVVSLVE